MSVDNGERLVFDALAQEYPAHYSEAATRFRKHATGFPAAVGGRDGVFWIGPAGIELAPSSVADGRRVPWADVADVDVPPAPSSRPSAGAVMLLGAWSLLLDPERPPLDVEITLTDGTVIATTVLASSEELRALTTSFRAARAGSAGELERLAALHDDGKLTDEEFSAAKRSLLGL